MIASLYSIIVLASGVAYMAMGTRVIIENGLRITIYDPWFFGTMLVTSFAVWRCPDSARWRALSVLWAIYAVYWANDLAELPEATAAFANVMVAGWFILTMQERWEWLIGLMFALMPSMALAAEFGLWPGYGQCGPGFLPLCGPVSIFGLGLVACYSLGLASDDGDGARASFRDIVSYWLGRPAPVAGILFRQRS